MQCTGFNIFDFVLFLAGTFLNSWLSCPGLALLLIGLISIRQGMPDLGTAFYPTDVVIGDCSPFHNKCALGLRRVLFFAELRCVARLEKSLCQNVGHSPHRSSCLSRCWVWSSFRLLDFEEFFSTMCGSCTRCRAEMRTCLSSKKKIKVLSCVLFLKLPLIA